MNTSAKTPKGPTISLPFFSVRNISSPEDTENGRKIYVGYAPTRAILQLPTDENVRDYLLDAEGKQRRRPTQVHRAINDTLVNHPHNFSVLNGGIVVVAQDCEIEEKDRHLRLYKPSIINGSQTQGVIRDFYNSLKSDSPEAVPFESHIKFEVIVTTDADLVAEISIARNFQNDVMALSIAGRRGQLDEIQKRLAKDRPGSRLQQSETELSDEYIKTERLLQVITALIPTELWPKGKDPNKVYTYSMKTKCLKEFQAIYTSAKDAKAPDHEAASRLYSFYLDVASQALDLYEKWKSHPGFKGTGIRSIEREGSEIRDVPDGIIFPILSALSAFAIRERGRWMIKPPSSFSDDELISAAKSVYMDIANHNPWNMGKSRSCYSALFQITSIYRRLSQGH